MSRTAFAVLPCLAIAAVTVSGCSTANSYPSLALRPIERVSLAEPATVKIPAGTGKAAADAHYAALVTQARDGDAAFRRALDEARPILLRGRNAAVGSDDWTAAQTRLSRLQPSRNAVAQALLTLQADSESTETRADTGLAAAASHALDTVAAIDRAEAEALLAVTPIRS